MPSLPSTPNDYTGEPVVAHKISLPGFPMKLKIEAVGQHYQVFSSRRESQRSYSEQERFEQEENSKIKGEIEDLSDDEEESPELLSLDPKYWKDQDHYEVMGISRLRFKATDEDIKNAFRKKVLKHHPDKKAQAGGSVEDDTFFKCVQKAFEVLSDPTTRMHFDSVDPTFEEDIPLEREITQTNFFGKLGPIFEANSRFSKKQPVPLLGDENTPEKEVTRFYDFWYNFDSWRIFNYLDEEDSMSGESRGDKRYLEKKNLKARAERKKEDNARIRSMTDLALKLDPRLRKFKDQEKKKKDADKIAKEKAKELELAAAKKKEDKAKMIETRRAEEEKAKADEKKKEKEAKANALRKFRKNIRQILKDSNYFLPEDTPQGSKTMVDALIHLEKVCESSTFEVLNALSDLSLKDPVEFETAYRTELKTFFDESNLPPVRVHAPKVVVEKKETSRSWSDEEHVLLIQAFKLFPGGTQGRWEKIAEHLNAHSRQPPRSVKEVTTEANNIKQKLESGKGLELETNKVVKKHDDTLIRDSPTQRSEVEPIKEAMHAMKLAEKAEKGENGESSEKGKGKESEESEGKPWTKEEQAILEQAMKKYPASDEGRWEKIASEVKTRNKKECMVRCKKLAQQIKDKKNNEEKGKK